MSGRPVHLLAAAAVAAVASLAPVSSASASCYGCGPSYAAPVAYYSAPVVYSYSYSAPSCGCGYSAPMYVVNHGPSYTAPVTIAADPTPAYYGHRRAYPHYGAGGMRWHRRGWHHRAGHHRYGFRHHGYRHGAAVPGYRHGWRARHPMIGPRGIYRGGMHRMQGPRFAHGPRPRFDMPHRAQRMHMMMRTPGTVHPRMMGHGPQGPAPGPRGPMKKMP